MCDVGEWASVYECGRVFGCLHQVGPVSYTHLDVYKRQEWVTAVSDYLEADMDVQAQPDSFYDRVIVINLSELEPHILSLIHI